LGQNRERPSWDTLLKSIKRQIHSKGNKGIFTVKSVRDFRK